MTNRERRETRQINNNDIDNKHKTKTSKNETYT